MKRSAPESTPAHTNQTEPIHKTPRTAEPCRTSEPQSLSHHHTTLSTAPPPPTTTPPPQPVTAAPPPASTPLPPLSTTAPPPPPTTTGPPVLNLVNDAIDFAPTHGNTAGPVNTVLTTAGIPVTITSFPTSYTSLYPPTLPSNTVTLTSGINSGLGMKMDVGEVVRRSMEMEQRQGMRQAVNSAMSANPYHPSMHAPGDLRGYVGSAPLLASSYLKPLPPPTTLNKTVPINAYKTTSPTGTTSYTIVAPPPSRSAVAASTRQRPTFWTKEEDIRLSAAVGMYKEKNWKEIATHVGTRNHMQCLQRWMKVLTPGLVKGQWSGQEDCLLISLVNKGFKNWGELAIHLKGRTSKQCRERWCHALDPSILKTNYTEGEDNVILSLQGKLGNRWATIAQSLPGRTENSVKIRFKVLVRNKKREEEGKPKGGARKVGNKAVKGNGGSQMTAGQIASQQALAMGGGGGHLQQSVAMINSMVGGGGAAGYNTTGGNPGNMSGFAQSNLMFYNPGMHGMVYNQPNQQMMQQSMQQQLFRQRQQQQASIMMRARTEAPKRAYITYNPSEQAAAALLLAAAGGAKRKEGGGEPALPLIDETKGEVVKKKSPNKTTTTTTTIIKKQTVTVSVETGAPPVTSAVAAGNPAASSGPKKQDQESMMLANYLRQQSEVARKNSTAFLSQVNKLVPLMTQKKGEEEKGETAE